MNTVLEITTQLTSDRISWLTSFGVKVISNGISIPGEIYPLSGLIWNIGLNFSAFHWKGVPISPEFVMISLRELQLPSVTDPNGTASLSNRISIPWHAPITEKSGCDNPANSKITYIREKTEKKIKDKKWLDSCIEFLLKWFILPGIHYIIKKNL